MNEVISIRDIILKEISCATGPCSPEQVVAYVKEHTAYEDFIIYAEILRMMQDNVIKSTITLTIA